MAGPWAFDNNAQSTSPGAITNSQLTLTLASSSAFAGLAAGQQAVLMIQDTGLGGVGVSKFEFVLATANNTGTNTITLSQRGFDGSTGQSFVAGATVTQVLSKSVLQTLAGGQPSISGPPTTGTWVLGQMSVDTNGIVWICTTAGSGGAAVFSALAGKLHAEVHQSANQVVPNNTVTVLTLDVVDSDPLVMWSTVNNRLTVPVAGRWRVFSTVTWLTPGVKVNPLSVAIYKNGAIARGGAQIAPASGDSNPAVTVAGPVTCALNDTLDIRVLQTAGTTYNTSAGAATVWATFEFAGA